jgi:hypothetical protein
MRILLLLVLVPFFILSCSGDGPPAITAQDLESMTLTKEELGTKFAGLNRIVNQSGGSTNGVANDGTDVLSFRQSFTGPIRLNVDLAAYKNVDGPREAVATMKEVALGSSLSGAVEEFYPPPIGDEVHGLYITGDSPGGETQIIVLSRLDRVFLLVAIEYAASAFPAGSELQNDAVDLATKQIDKIEAALDA